MINKISKALIIILPLIGFVITLFFSTNIPLWDDYEIILGFLVDFATAENIGQKISTLFEPSSNYLFMTLRLLAAADFMIFGKINFAHLIFVNSCFHLGIYYLFIWFFRRTQEKWYLFIPISLLLAVPTFEVQNWAAYTVHVMAVFFTLLTLYLLAQNWRHNAYLAFVSAFFALLSAPLGFLAFLIALIPIYHRAGGRAVFKWLASFIAVAMFYVFLILPLGAEIKGPVESRTPFYVYLINVLVFYGSILKALYQQYHWWGLIFSLAIAFAFTALLPKWKSLWQNQPILSAGLLLAILLPMVIAVMRSHHGMGATTTYRYRLYQTLPLMFLYLYLCQMRKSDLKKFYPLILGFSMLLFGFRMPFNIDQMKIVRLRQQTGLYHYKVAKSPEYLSWGNPQLTSELLEEVKRLTVYDYEMMASAPLLITKHPKEGRLQPLNIQIKETLNEPDFLHISGWAWTSYTPTSEFQILMQLSDEAQQLLYQTGPMINSRYGKEEPESGFIFTIEKKEMALNWENTQLEILLVHSIRGLIGREKIPIAINAL